MGALGSAAADAAAATGPLELRSAKAGARECGRAGGRALHASRCAWHAYALHRARVRACACSSPVDGSGCLDVGATLEEELDASRVAGLARLTERREPVRARGVDVNDVDVSFDVSVDIMLTSTSMSTTASENLGKIHINPYIVHYSASVHEQPAVHWPAGRPAGGPVDQQARQPAGWSAGGPAS